MYRITLESILAHQIGHLFNKAMLYKARTTNAPPIALQHRTFPSIACITIAINEYYLNLKAARSITGP